MKYRGFGIVECKMLCENPTLADLGVHSDLWLPFAFDLQTVLGVKLAVEEDHTDSIQHGCAQVFFKGTDQYMIIDIPYHDMKLLWVAFKTDELPDDPAYAELAVAFMKSLVESDR